MDPTIRTLGQKALIDWLRAERGRSQGTVATALGVSQPAVGYWVKGTSRPEGAKRAALLALCGIPEADWETEDERRQRDAALARIAASDPTPQRITILDEPETKGGTGGEAA